jgi:outer membrane biosynthesis protein TonB
MRVTGCCLGMLLFISACATQPRAGSPPPEVPTGQVTRDIRPGPGFPQTEDFYPLEARKLGQTGATDVRACVDTMGKLTAPPTLVRTSGSPILDHAAIALATAGSGHYVPAIEHGMLVSKCIVYSIRFG